MPTGIHHPSASPRVAHARVPGMARGGSSTSAMLAAQEAAAAPLLAPQLWPAAQQPPQPKPAVALQHSAKATMDTIKSSINATELQQALQQLWDGESSTAAGSMKLNHVHLSAALTHLAQLEDKRRKGGSSSHGYAAAQQLGRQLLDQATQHHMLALMGPRQVSNMMWASGRLGIAQGQEPGTTQQQVTASQCREASQPWLALVQAMQQHMKAVQTAPFATFSNTSRAGGGGQTSRGDHKKGRGAQPHCNIVDIVQAVHSCATAGLHPGGGWMKDALAASRPQLGRLGAQEAAILAWALAVLQQIQPRHANTGALAEAHGPLPTGDWLPAFMHAALPLLPSMSGQELALLVWALPQLLASRGAAPSGVQPALQQHLQQGQEHHEPAEGAEDRAPVTPLPAQLPDWEQQVYAAALSAAATSHLSVHDKALLLRGVGGLGWRPGQSWVDQVLGDKPWPQQASQQQQQQQQAHTQVQGVHPSKRSSRLTKASQQPHARSLANLVSSVLDLGCRPSQPWLSQALGAALQSPGGCDAADVAGLLRACVLTGHSPAAHQVEGLLSAARPHLRNAPLPQVSDIVWASARLRYMPNPAWTQAMVAATGTRFPSAPGAHTAPGKTVPLPPSRPQRAPQAAARHHQLSLTVSDKPVSYAPIHSFAQQQHQHQQVVFSSSGPAPLPPSLSASEVDALVKLLWAAAELQRHCTHASESSSSSSSMSPSSTSSVSSTANGAASCNSAASHSTLASAARVDPSRTPHTLSPARPPDARASVIPPLSPPTQLQQPRRPLLESGSVTTPLMRPAPVLSTALQQPSDRSPSPTPPPPAGRAASQEEVVTQSPQQRVDSSSSSRQGALLWVPASWVSQAVGTLSHASEAGRPQKMLKPIHIVQLVWALKTLNVVPSSAARTWLAAAVAAHAHALSPSQLVTVMAYMPRFALRRQHDRCGLLRVLIKALVKALPQMSPLQASRALCGLADMGYALSRSAVAQLAEALAQHQHSWSTLGAEEVSSFLAALASLGFGQLSGTGPSAPASARLQSTLLGAALRPDMCRAYSLPQAISLLTALADLGWCPAPRQWTSLYSSLLRQAGSGASGADVAHLLFCLAQYKGRITALSEAAADCTPLPASSPDAKPDCADMQPLQAQLSASSEGGPLALHWVPPKRHWITRMLACVRADLSSIPPRQVAELLAALVRLGHDPGGPWVAGLLAQLEARSALFDKMDHAMLRGAWAELSSARARHRATKERPRHVAMKERRQKAGDTKEREHSKAGSPGGPEQGSDTLEAEH